PGRKMAYLRGEAERRYPHRSLGDAQLHLAAHRVAVEPAIGAEQCIENGVDPARDGQHGSGSWGRGNEGPQAVDLGHVRSPTATTFSSDAPVAARRILSAMATTRR